MTTPGTYHDQKGQKLTYSDFVNKELIQFFMADLQRSIPSMLDGLKPEQRKILFCAFKRNFVREGKVDQFYGYACVHSAYHHGEESFAKTLIGMAQDYVGSNNINLLQPIGQFGTRYLGGKDHARARYLYTCLSPITRLLFPKDDDILLDYLNEDGQSIEPTRYMPIIPMVLVNGGEGIGREWSTYIPSYSPRDIVANVRRLLNDEPTKPMHPWYKGFRGEIQKTSAKESEGSYTTIGTIKKVDNTTLMISELPIGKWTEEYKEFLESITTGKDPFIKDYREYHDDTTVHFEVILSKKNMAAVEKEDLLKKFKLTTTISTSNMHLFDPNGMIRKYDNAEQILEEFFHIRLGFYAKRKAVLLPNLERELLKLENKARFIEKVVKKEIIVFRRKRAELIIELGKYFTPFPKKTNTMDAAVAGATEDAEVGSEGVRASDFDYLLSMPIKSLMREGAEELCAYRDKLKGEINELSKATPKSLWIKDLDALERELDKQDKIDVQVEAEGEKMKNSVMGEADLEAPARKAEEPSLVLRDEDDVDEEVPELKDRVAAYNPGSSPDHSEGMDTGVHEAQARKKLDLEPEA